MPRLPSRIHVQPTIGVSKTFKLPKKGKQQLTRDASFVTQVEDSVLENISHDYESMLLPTRQLVAPFNKKKVLDNSVPFKNCHKDKVLKLKNSSSLTTPRVGVHTEETMSACSCSKEDCAECNCQYEYESMPHFGREESEPSFVPVGDAQISNEVDPLQQPERTFLQVVKTVRRKPKTFNEVFIEEISTSKVLPPFPLMTNKVSRKKQKTESESGSVSIEVIEIEDLEAGVEVGMKDEPARKRKPVNIKKNQIDDAKTVGPSNVDPNLNTNSSLGVRMPAPVKILPKPIEQNLRKVVDLRYAVQWALGLQFNHSRICPEGQLVVKSENKKGLSPVNELILECNVCLYRSNQ